MNKRKVEVFSAGCPACAETVKLVQQITCSSCEVEVLDMNKPEVATRARQYGVKTVPAVAINGKLTSYCAPARGRMRRHCGVPVLASLRKKERSQ